MKNKLIIFVILFIVYLPVVRAEEKISIDKIATCLNKNELYDDLNVVNDSNNHLLVLKYSDSDETYDSLPYTDDYIYFEKQYTKDDVIDFIVTSSISDEILLCEYSYFGYTDD